MAEKLCGFTRVIARRQQRQNLKVKGKRSTMVGRNASFWRLTPLRVNVTYFETGGSARTDETLQLAADRARVLGIKYVLVPTTSGATAARAVDAIKGVQIVAITHMTGFAKPGEQ